MPKIRKEKTPKIIKNYLPTLKNPSRSWVFTQYNGVEVDIDPSKWTEEIKSRIRYFVYQHEICPETKREHWQGFIQLFTPHRYTTINKLLPQLFGSHFEPKFKKAKPSESAAYCKKEESRKPDTVPIEYGQVCDQGEKTDEEIRDLLEEGVPVREIAHEHFSTWMRNYRAIEIYSAWYKPVAPKEYQKEDFTQPLFSSDILKKKSVFIYGPSGIGKTHFAIAHFNNPLVVDDIDKLKELTKQHDGIVFDDMSFKHIPAEAVIKLVDLAIERTIRCRNTNATIPKGLPRIFTHNCPEIFYEPTVPDVQKQAINRRVYRTHFERDLFSDKPVVVVESLLE